MLVELAIGDAYGAGFEYAEPLFIRENNDLSYRQHPKHLGIKPGMYTDDTQMTLAIAEMMVECAEWTEKNLADKYVEVFKRDPREGYASSFYHFLEKVADGEQFLAEIRGDSDKSGAAMRAPVLGLIQDKDELKEKCEIQAAITHNSRDGINAALAAAMMVHFFKWEGGKKAELSKYLKAHVKGDWGSRWTGKVRSKGWMSVRAAITAIMDSTSMAELLKRCIAYTGDVDTVATIALAGASHSKEIKKDLPTWLYHELEDGTYGKSYLEKLDKQLVQALKS